MRTAFATSTARLENECFATPVGNIRGTLKNLKVCGIFLSLPSVREAARILLDKREKVTFQTAEVASSEETYDDFDYMLFTALEDTREYFLEVLQNRQIPMRLRMWKILAAASDFQRYVDRNQLFKWEEIRERHKASGYGEAFTSRVQKWRTKKAAPDELEDHVEVGCSPNGGSKTGLAGISEEEFAGAL